MSARYYMTTHVRSCMSVVCPQVIQTIPDSWSIAMMSQFLKKAIRSNMHLNRMTRIDCMMSRGENLLVKQMCIDEQREPVIMNEER